MPMCICCACRVFINSFPKYFCFTKSCSIYRYLYSSYCIPPLVFIYKYKCMSNYTIYVSICIYRYYFCLLCYIYRHLSLYMYIRVAKKPKLNKYINWLHADQSYVLFFFEFRSPVFGFFLEKTTFEFAFWNCCNFLNSILNLVILGSFKR